MLVWRRHPGQYASQTPMVEGRDFFVDDVLGRTYQGETVEPGLDARRGAAVPDVHQRHHRPAEGLPSTPPAATSSYVAGTSKYYQDIHPDDTYWCMADIGWITGHSYIVYGPLALGTTTRDLRGRPRTTPTPAGRGGSPSSSA